jgi:MYXO-CTERM domain-containing protein
MPTEHSHQNLTVRLSTTSRDSLSRTYDENFGSDVTTVYEGPIIYTAEASGPPEGPRPSATISQSLEFEPFYYDPDHGNLLIEWAFQPSYTVTPGNIVYRSDVQSLPFTGSVGFTVDPSHSPVFDFNAGVVWELTFARQIPGDFDHNGLLNLEDVTELGEQIISGEYSGRFDLNQDSSVNEGDLRIWIKDLSMTWYGDANLDGEFNTADFVQVFDAGKYETKEEAGWAQGDWNGDGVFGTGDLVMALEDGGYEKGPREDVAAVPEPTGWWLLLVGLLPGLRRRPARSAV